MQHSQIEHFNDHAINMVFHDTGEKRVVIFCHGFRSSSIGPNRFFVRAARKLAQHGISSLRFDQYGSGNSEGDFYDSSFNDWVATARTIADSYLGKGYKVALFGQSMGGAATIAVGSQVPRLAAIVSWVPDANVDEFRIPKNGLFEEGGQIVQASYWQEAHDMKVGDLLAHVRAPMYIVQCTADEYVDEANRNKIMQNAQPHHKVSNFEGYSHSSWTYDQSENIIIESVNFLVNHL